MSFGDLKVQDLIYEDSSNNEITVVIADLATKANPTFTGTVTVPTATAGDNSTKAASTAFVVASFAPKSAPTFTGTINGADLILSGNLTVSGTQTIINTSVLDVEDINITLGKVSSPSDTTANNGGITLKGSTDKTFNWLNATDSWTSSEHIEIASGKNLKVDGTTFFVDGTNNRVGIGTTSPSTALTLDHSSEIYLTLKRANANHFQVGTDNSGHYLVGREDKPIIFANSASSAYTERMRLDSSGRLLIGTNATGSKSNPAPLQVKSSASGAFGINVRMRSNNDYGFISFTDDDASEDLVQLGVNRTAADTAHFSLYTNGGGASASERIRIGASGQLGIGGATYGSSGQVLTSGGSGAAPSWTTISSAPQLEATADGAITAGKPCIITAAGKVQQVANSASAANGLIWNSGSAASQGTAITPASGYYNTVAYDDDSDTVALVYKDGGSNIKLRLFSTSGNGLGIIADPVIVSGLSSTTIFCICKLSSRRFAVPYWNFAYGGNGRMEIVIVTVNSSANGISTGSAYSLDGTNNFSFYNEPHAVAIGDNRIAVIAKAHNTSCQVPNGKMALLVGDISSGNVYTARSNAQITSDTGDGQYRSIGYDSTNDVVGVAFTNNSNDVKFVGCKVAAGTGAAITQGTATDLTTAGNKPNIKWHSNSGSWITAVAHNNTSLRVQAHTINSGTLAITSGTAIDNTTQGYPAYMVDICISNQHQIYFNYINASKKLYSLSATVSGTALTLNTSDITEQLTDHSTAMEKLAAEFMAHNDKIVMFATISGNYVSGTGNTTNITSNLTSENYIGVANASVSNNATATIDVSGSTNSSQSSLTPGQKYYVQKDGTFGLTEDTTKVFAGTAVAATKILVNDQQPILTPTAPIWETISYNNDTSGVSYVESKGWDIDRYSQIKIIGKNIGSNSNFDANARCYFKDSNGTEYLAVADYYQKVRNSQINGSTVTTNNRSGLNHWKMADGNSAEYFDFEYDFLVGNTSASSVTMNVLRGYHLRYGGVYEHQDILSFGLIMGYVISGFRFYHATGGNFSRTGRLHVIGLVAGS